MDKTVVKAINLFELLSNSSAPMGVSEIAMALQLQKSNVHRLLKTMEKLGYVRQRPDLLYESTLRVWELGTKIIERIDVRAIARSELVALAKESGESVHLSKLESHEVLYLDKIDSDNPVRAYTQVGGRAPCYCTATGKAQLAFLPDAEIAAIAKKLPRYTPRTISNGSALRKELEDIREQGFAVNNGEWRAHVSGLAAPVLDHRGEVIAAIGISGPIERLKPKVLRNFAPAVMATAARASRALGYLAPEKSASQRRGASTKKRLPQEA